MSAEVPDAVLVAAARAGSDAAFSRLVDRHGPAVRGFARRISPAPDDADDIAQEAFLSAWTRLRGLKEADRFKAWLMAIAWRKARERARSMGRSRTRETAWQGEQETSADPASDLAIAARRALSQLPVEQRAAVALCLAGGWSHGEAAGILNLPLGTVKSHVSRGRVRLQQVLGERDDG